MADPLMRCLNDGRSLGVVSINVGGSLHGVSCIDGGHSKEMFDGKSAKHMGNVHVVNKSRSRSDVGRSDHKAARVGDEFDMV